MINILNNIINKNNLTIEELVEFEKNISFNSKKKEVNKLTRDLRTLKNLLEIELLKQMKRDN